MSKTPDYMILELDGEYLYIEVTDARTPNSQNMTYRENSMIQPNEESFEPPRLSGEQLKQLAKIGGKLFEHFKEFQADEMEISFSVKADVETKLFLFTKADLDGQFGVKLTWRDRKNRKKNKETTE